MKAEEKDKSYLPQRSQRPQSIKEKVKETPFSGF